MIDVLFLSFCPTAATLPPSWTRPPSGASTPEAMTTPVDLVEQGETLSKKVWRSCEAFLKSCMGSALDNPNYRAGVVASVGECWGVRGSMIHVQMYLDSLF
jgi:hypothetical protein